MKTIQYAEFGDSRVLQLQEVSKPVPQAQEVLLKVAAASINSLDIKLRTGEMQQRIPIQLPFIPGLDVAGTVAAVGPEVTRLKVGDFVFATTDRGTYAEYVALPEENVALTPANVSLPEAAALGLTLVTAYTFLVENSQLQAGQRLLIHGAAGGVGSVMVQLAKALGAYVIGTATGAGVALAHSLGADEVIDYKTQDFSQLVHEVDIVIDLVGGEAQAKSYQVMKPGGRLFSAVMPPDQEKAKEHQVTARFLNSAPSYKKLDYGRRLVEAGKIKPLIAKAFPLAQAAQAQDLLSAGGLAGKVVLEV